MKPQVKKSRIRSKPKGVRPAPVKKGRVSRNSQRYDSRPSMEIKSKSSNILLARAKKFLNGLLEKYGSTAPKGDILKSLLKAKLSDKFRRMQRKHRQKALAVAAALYHYISRQPDPAAALKTLVKKMHVSPPRGSDPCRTIVEWLFDYGTTAEERTQNRQYACTDANALRYIIRKEIEPQKVLAPDEGESITEWARREADYRRPKTPSNTRPKVAGTTRLEKAEYREPDTSPKAPKSKRSKNSNWTDGKLPILRPSEKRYRFFEKCTRKGVFLVDPEDKGPPLAIIIAELTNVTVDEAERRPYKVRTAIEKALDRHIRKSTEGSSPAPLSRGPARKSIPSGRHPSQKALGAGRRERPSIAEIIEGANP